MYYSKEQEKDRERFIDKSTGLEMEQVTEPQSLLEWFTEKYKDFGAQLEVNFYVLWHAPVSDLHILRYFP